METQQVSLTPQGIRVPQDQTLLIVDDDRAFLARLARAIWRFLHESRAPFEQVFFDLRGGLSDPQRLEHSPARALYQGGHFDEVRAALAAFSPLATANLDHPYFREATPCTMLIDEVEAIWAPIADRDDWSPFSVKLAAIATMADAYGTGPEVA